MNTTVSVVGVDTAGKSLAEFSDVLEARIGLGLQAWGTVIQSQARRNIAEHHFTGLTERSTTVSAVTKEGPVSTVTVGVHGGLAPQARPLELGWRSSTGKQPPSDAIYRWLTGSSKGAAALSGGGVEVKRNKSGFITGSRSRRVSGSDESRARGLAFVIARKIGRRPGFKIGALHWLSNAMVETVERGRAAFLAKVRS